MNVVNIEKTDQRRFTVPFVRHEFYTAPVVVPDHVETVLQDGEPKIIVTRSLPYPWVGSGREMMSLQRAVELKIAHLESKPEGA
jgi:hypothetical protein